MDKTHKSQPEPNPNPQDYSPYPTQPPRMQSEHEIDNALKNELNFSIVTYSHLYNKIL